MTKLIARGRSLLGDRKGVTALEYGLIAAFISVALIAIMPGVTGALTTAFGRITSSLTSGS